MAEFKKGQHRGAGAVVRDKAKHRTYIQKPIDRYLKKQLTVKGSDIHATWFLHDGNTQIHIALADFKQAAFDVVILPINKQRAGINVFSEERSTKNYGTLFTGPFSVGEYLTVKHPKELACNSLIGVMFTDRVYAIDSLREMVGFQKGNKKKPKHHVRTLGIPVPFDRFFDPSLFLESIVKIRHADNDLPFSCFFCCKGQEPELVPFMNSVNLLLGDADVPRRFISPTFTDAFPALNVSTTIVSKGILDTECECIVAAIGSNFSLEKSQLTQAIERAAGNELQQDIDKIVGRGKRNYQDGDVIHCGSRGLSVRKIKSILFGILPKWRQGINGKDFVRALSNFVKECTLIADDNGCKSVAFPVLGSGYLSYPEDAIVSSLLDGIDMYASTGMHGCVSKVVIAHIEGANSPLFKKFQKEICRRRSMTDGHNKVGKIHDSQIDDNVNTMTNDDLESEFEMEICKRRSMKERCKNAASADPKNTDNVNYMTNDEFKSKSKKEIDSDVQYLKKKNQKKTLSGKLNDSQSADNKNAMKNDEFESLYDEVTADVNPGITEYLIGTEQTEKFKVFLSKEFGVDVDNIDGKLVLKGTWTNITQAEDYIENSLATGNMFNDADVDAASIDEPLLVKSSVNCVTSQNMLKEDKEVAVEDTVGNSMKAEHHTQLKTIPYVAANAKSAQSKELTCIPIGIHARRFNVAEGYSLNVFNANDLFSFKTDIKVVATTKNFTHENDFIRQVLDTIPECRKEWGKERDNTDDEFPMEIVPLSQENTCRYIFFVVIPYIKGAIPKTKGEKEKTAYKSNIVKITQNIMNAAVALKVQSITLPFLVHTGNDAATNMCCHCMAQTILGFLKQQDMKHVNVLLDSDNTKKIFCNFVKQNLHGTAC